MPRLGYWIYGRVSHNYSDADGDAASKFEFRTNTKGHAFWASGVGFFDGVGGKVITAAQMSGLWVRGQGVDTTQAIEVRAHDGKDWGPWANATIVTGTATNNLPVVTIADQSVQVGQTKNIGSAVSATDADGDAITKYEVKDNTGTDNFTVDGSVVNAKTGHEFVASKLNTLTVKADGSASTQTLQIRAYDGKGWSNWTSFKLTTIAANKLPTVSIADQKLSINARTFLQHKLSAADADGDTITQYEVKDATGGSNFMLNNGSVVNSGSGYAFAASQLNTLVLAADGSPSTQTLQIRANDGKGWGP